MSEKWIIDLLGYQDNRSRDNELLEFYYIKVGNSKITYSGHYMK